MSMQGQLLSTSLVRTIPSKSAEVEFLCMNIRTFLQACGTRKAFEIELLTRECLANAMLHGNKNDQARLITLQLHLGRIWIRLRVRDEGEGFRWKGKDLETVDATTTCGRGLQLCRLFAAKMKFSNSGNEISLWIERTEEERINPKWMPI